MGRTNGSRDLATPQRPLDVAVGLALMAEVPTRVYSDDGDTVVELFVHRGFVIHANCDGKHGLDALEAMLEEGLWFSVEYGAWPSRCTVMTRWPALRREAERRRYHAMGFPRRDEALAPIYRV